MLGEDTLLKSSSGRAFAYLGKAPELQTFLKRDKGRNEGAGTAKASCLPPLMTSTGGSSPAIASKPTGEMGKVTSSAGTQSPRDRETRVAAGRETTFLPGEQSTRFGVTRGKPPPLAALRRRTPAGDLRVSRGDCGLAGDARCQRAWEIWGFIS